MTKEKRFDLIYDKITDNIENGENVFLTGGAGVGKSQLVKEVLEYFTVIQKFQQKRKSIQILAPTGIAAQLVGGETINSYLKLGICNSIEELRDSNIRIKKTHRDEVANLKLIIIDEISMVSQRKMEMIESRLKQLGFKGSLMLVGDFYQLPPVSIGFKEEFAFTSKYWEKLNLNIYSLNDIFRTKDQKFIEVLTQIRSGDLKEEDKNYLDTLIKEEPQNKVDYTYLLSTNNKVKAHNEEQLKLLPEKLKKCEAKISNDSKTKESLIDKFIEENRFEKELNIKVGAPILFLINDEDFKNGERGIITNIYDNTIFIEKENKEVVELKRRRVLKIVKEEYEIDGVLYKEEKVLYSFSQFPIRLAFAITIHKSQGMSISSLVIDPNNIFEKSQFYVAISRATNTHNLIILPKRKNWGSIIYVDNKVHSFMEKVEGEMLEFWRNNTE